MALIKAAVAHGLSQAPGMSKPDLLGGTERIRGHPVCLTARGAPVHCQRLLLSVPQQLLPDLVPQQLAFFRCHPRPHREARHN